jgi:hypothetical protein
MEIKNFITIYDDVIPLKTIGNLIRFLKKVEFEKTAIGGKDNKMDIDFNIRKTYGYSFHLTNDSMTNVHWYNLLHCLFKEKLFEYKITNNIIDYGVTKINDIEALKYENTGFYTWHVDHFATFPRTMSCILLLNNDYEGGNLCFRNPNGSGEWEVEVKSGRMIIWPSNFLYPHTVKPVTKGTRYSVVAWAL